MLQGRAVGTHDPQQLARRVVFVARDPADGIGDLQQPVHRVIGVGRDGADAVRHRRHLAGAAVGARLLGQPGGDVDAGEGRAAFLLGDAPQGIVSRPLCGQKRRAGTAAVTPHQGRAPHGVIAGADGITARIGRHGHVAPGVGRELCRQVQGRFGADRSGADRRR